MTASIALRVAQISFHLDPQRDPQRILGEIWTIVDCAELVARTGAQVSVIQACIETAHIERNGVDYYFLRPETAGLLADSPSFAALIRRLNCDVHHVHGLAFPGEVLALARLSPATPIYLQDHASGVPRPWRRRQFRRGLAAAQAISFCSLAQARPFMDVGLIAPSTTVYEVPETSSRFTPGDRLVARRASGVYGDPAILWVGHLDSNKDPLTVLDGVAAAVPDLPDAQMWCCFGKAPLMPKVEARIAGDERLRDRVHLLGRVSHDRVEQLMRAADIFVLGSHREGSGCSLIEALACGLPAAVTSIPSFAALMGPEGVGATWPCGDAEVLRQALVRLAAQPREALREAVRGHFERELSFEGVGRKLINVYEGLLRRRSRPTPHNG